MEIDFQKCNKLEACGLHFLEINFQKCNYSFGNQQKRPEQLRSKIESIRLEVADKLKSTAPVYQFSDLVEKDVKLVIKNRELIKKSLMEEKREKYLNLIYH